MTFSSPKIEEDVIKVPKRTTRNSTRLSMEESRRGGSGVNGSGLDDRDTGSLEPIGVSMMEAKQSTKVETVKESTKIALPFADTPVINRNKELRRKTGNRRSSLGMRGRRASSLIENGHSAIPHHQVETSQFYKHIEANGLSEPRRMKQLLTWCGERALGAKPSHNIADSAAVLAGTEYSIGHGNHAEISSTCHSGTNPKGFCESIRNVGLV
jgi:kinetochore protein Mis13/DSN1